MKQLEIFKENIKFIHWRELYAGSLYENGQSNAQTLGGRTLYFNHNSFSIQNDYWGDKKDRWRTNAWELTVGKYSVGSSVYTNDGNAESKGIVERLKKSPIWGLNRPHHEGSELGGWDKGSVYSSPLWIGFRAGSIVTRMGYSHRSFQDFQQNGIHKWYRFGRQNYYADYEKFRHGLYYYTGYYNPFSLY